MTLAEIDGETLPAGFHTKTQIVLADLDDEIGHFVIAGQQLPADLLGGVDLTQSIFEVDVAQSLARLERVLLDRDCPPHIIIGEFRAQSEVFTGIASLTNTPGFGKLAHATITALDRHPDRAREICCFALVDFYIALEAVLIGDSPQERLRHRATCGAISPGFAFLIAEPSRSTGTAEIGTLDWQSEISNLEDLQNLHSSLSGDVCDLEDLFEGDFALEQILDLEHSDLDSFDGVAGSAHPKNPALSVGSWSTAEGEEDRTSFLDNYQLLSDRSLLGGSPFLLYGGAVTQSQLKASVSPLSEPEVDFLIEDILWVPEFGAAASLDFDLVEIFDVASEESWRTPEIAVFLPELDDADVLGFDLADIFDLASSTTDPLATNIYRSQIIDTIADTIGNFDKLAPVTLETFAQPAQVIKRARVKKKSHKIDRAPAPQLSVRVALDRLDRMNNLMGELAIERHGLDLSNEQFNDTLGRLRAKCENFQTIGDRLRDIADTLAISAQYPQLPSDTPKFSVGEDLTQQFDVLELDRYSEVHNIAQATIEQLLQIEEQIEDLSLFVTQSHRQIDRQKQLLSHLRDDLMWSRMLPLGEILNRFPRTLHDLSIEFNKPVDLKITGAGVLVDRVAIDKLFDPLVHLLRNAFDHGIDLPAVRQAAGKPERGSIEITAYHQGSQTVIEISDDGRGINLDAIKAKAIALELLPPEDADTITREQLLDFLFEPGFSTADRITKLSGRGMGLDIVKEQIQSIKGTISIESHLGKGTTFALRIPLTLTIAQLMVCQVGRAVYAFPADSIQKIVVPTTDQLSHQDSHRIFQWRNLTIPVYNLAELLTYAIPIPERTISHTLKSSANNPEDWLSPILLIRTGNQLVALEIDRLITEQELTIVPFGKSITPPSYSYGCTILGDGVILPVLDPHTLIQVLIERPRSSQITQLPPLPTIANTSNSILVVDDSVTTRQSLCLSLEKYGYRTIQAKDGQEALQLLRQKTSELKLVVCDVEMPNMNGFEFLNVRRQDPTITHIPVVMLTSRSNTKHRQFAAHLGAIDYFIKPYVEQDFMKAIGKIIE
jgi:two-component system, chemotaxis family, sensor histidine kinase and response regulator PixL